MVGTIVRFEVRLYHYRLISESVVWKLVHRAPSRNLNMTYTAFDIDCPNYVYLNPPYLFNIDMDPGENNPIHIDSSTKYTAIVSAINKASEKHKKRIPKVESMLTLWRVLWYPHLQPCCNFPTCSCLEAKYKEDNIS